MYVKRDAEGHLEAVSKVVVEGFDEQLDDDSQEIKAFLEQQQSGRDALAATDTELVRVLEDLIDLLVDKDVIHFTDLPAPAQRKLLQRRDTRVSMREGLRLLDDENEPGLL